MYLGKFLFIGTPEVIFVIFIALMIFGADKIPEIARGLAKGMNTLKNASNDLKNEISKSAQQQGIDIENDIAQEIKQVKEDFEDITGSIKRKL